MMPAEQYLQEMQARDILKNEQTNRYTLRTKSFETNAIELDELKLPKKKQQPLEQTQQGKRHITPRAASYLVNKKRLDKDDFETEELLRPVEDQIGRRYSASSSSSSSIFSERRGDKTEGDSEETLEFISAKYAGRFSPKRF